MAIDIIAIGNRIREIRETLYNETRSKFSSRCDITESHLGQIERAEVKMGLEPLDKIASAAGITTDYLLYGGNDKENLSMRKAIDTFLDHSTPDEIEIYFKCISSIKEFVIKKEKNISKDIK